MDEMPDAGGLESLELGKDEARISRDERRRQATLARHRVYYHLNPERYREHNRQWRKNNPEKVKAQYRRWVTAKLDADPDWSRRRHREWLARDPGRAAEDGRRRHREAARIWRGDSRRASSSLRENQKRGALGEVHGLRWLRELGFSDIHHLSQVWHAFPFDFVANYKGGRAWIDATVTLVKKVKPVKNTLARILGGDIYILFVTPDGRFAHLEEVRDRPVVLVPRDVLHELRARDGK